MRPVRAAGLILLGTVVMAIGAGWGGGRGTLLVVGGAWGMAAVLAWTWRRLKLSLRLVLGVAVVARLILLPLPPALSDDGYRYIWDGRMQAAGINPYEHRPSEVVGGDEALLAAMNSAEFYSVYPPGSQLLFLLSSVIGIDFYWSWIALKAAMVLIELVALLVLARSVSPVAVAFYAWNPLVLMETAGQGHTEAALVGLLLLAWYGLRSGRSLVAGGALAAAVWVKLWPLLLLPLTRGLGWRGWLGFGVILIGMALPYATPFVVPNVLESLTLYTSYFEWNAGLYFLMKWIAGEAFGGDWSGPIGGGLAGLFLLAWTALVVLARVCRLRVETTWALVAGGFLVFSTTVHPWYLLGVLALLPLLIERSARARQFASAWEWLAACSMGTYLFYAFGATPYWLVVITGWVGWLALTLIALRGSGQALMRSRGRTKWARIQEFVPPAASVLDLGCAEGHVGESAARAGHRVTLADITPMNRTILPFHRLDPKSPLPFTGGAFDVTLLIFVLHHADRPEAVLDEACRVSQDRLIVWESVVESQWDRWWLPFADRWANRLRSRGRMSDRLDHRSAAEWREAFETCGLRVAHEQAFGNAFHRQHLFVLELVSEAAQEPH